MNEEDKKYIFDLSYHIILLIKGIDGLFEVIGGFLIIFLNPNTIDKIIVKLTQHELSTDPDDKIANAMIDFGHSLSLNSFQFDIFYLIMHGLIKCVLISLLWRKKLWAYPLCIVVFGLFVVYQIYRFTLTHSTLLILLSIFDIIMIYMSFVDLKKINTELHLNNAIE